MVQDQIRNVVRVVVDFAVATKSLFVPHELRLVPLLVFFQLRALDEP